MHPVNLVVITGPICKWWRQLPCNTGEGGVASTHYCKIRIISLESIHVFTTKIFEMPDKFKLTVFS